MTVDIGVVGAGSMASTHVDNLDGLDAQFVAACSRTTESARELAEPRGAQVSPDAETMLAEAALDAVIVAVPPAAHEGQELLAVDNDVALFVEKPLALSRETAREVRDAVVEADIVTAVTARKPTPSGVGGSASAPFDSPPTTAGLTPQIYSKLLIKNNHYCEAYGVGGNSNGAGSA